MEGRKIAKKGLTKSPEKSLSEIVIQKYKEALQKYSEDAEKLTTALFMLEKHGILNEENANSCLAYPMYANNIANALGLLAFHNALDRANRAAIESEDSYQIAENIIKLKNSNFLTTKTRTILLGTATDKKDKVVNLIIWLQQADIAEDCIFQLYKDDPKHFFLLYEPIKEFVDHKIANTTNCNLIIKLYEANKNKQILKEISFGLVNLFIKEVPHELVSPIEEVSSTIIKVVTILHDEGLLGDHLILEALKFAAKEKVSEFPTKIFALFETLEKEKYFNVNENAKIQLSILTLRNPNVAETLFNTITLESLDNNKISEICTYALAQMEKSTSSKKITMTWQTKTASQSPNNLEPKPSACKMQ